MSELEALHLQVAQRLGRCVLRIQQYEYLLKALLIEMDGSLTSDGRRESKGKPIEKFSLGELVQKFKVDHLDGGALDQGQVGESGDDACLFRFRAKFRMLPAQFDELVAQLEELTAMRNALIHHLIGDFEMSDANGCFDAIRHLKECMDRIALHFMTLKKLVASYEEARRLIWELKEFQSLLAQEEDAAQR